MIQLVDHNDDVCGVAFGQGGEMLISGSSDYTARIWRMGLNQSPVPIAELAHPDAVSGVDFHPEGREVVTACADGGVRVWASTPLTHTVKPIELRERTCAAPLWSACFSPNGTHIASGASDGTIPVWCWQRRSLVSVLKGHTGCVLAAKFGHDSSTLCSASRDRSVRVWDTGCCQQVLELWGHDSSPTCCAFGNPGFVVFSGGHDKVVRQWDLSSGLEVAQYRGHTAGVYGVAVSGDGRVMASTSWDGTCRVWSTLTQKQLSLLHLAPNGGGGEQAGQRATGLSASRGLAVAMSWCGVIAVGLNAGALCIFDPPAAAPLDSRRSSSSAHASATTSTDLASAPPPPPAAAAAAPEEWLVDALQEHLAADTRVEEFVDTHAAAAASGGDGEGGAIGADVKGDWLPPLHTAYQDLVISVIEEVQEAFAVGGEAVMAAVGALAARARALPRDPLDSGANHRDSNVQLSRLGERIEAVQDAAVLSTLLARRAREMRSAAAAAAAPATAPEEEGVGAEEREREKEAMEEELAALRARLEQERVSRELEAQQRERQRVAELQARLDFAAARESESMRAIEELEQQKAALAAMLEEQRQQSERMRAETEAAHLLEASAGERDAAAHRRAAAEMEEAAAEERKRRDLHDQQVAQRLLEVEAERERAETESRTALLRMQAMQEERRTAEESQQALHQQAVARMEEEVSALRAAAAAAASDDAKRQADALELKIAQQEKCERFRRAETAAQAAAEAKAAADATAKAEAEKAAADTAAAEKAGADREAERLRREEHEQRFQELLSKEKAAASQEMAAALEHVRKVTEELEQQRLIESGLRAEVAAREKEHARLEQELHTQQQQQQQQQQPGASSSSAQLEQLEAALRDAEKGKAKAKKRVAQTMLEKEKALDQCREARLQDEEKMRVLEKERELARLERDRLEQALSDLLKEQARRSGVEEELAKMKNKNRLCLDISDDSVHDSLDMSRTRAIALESPSKLSLSKSEKEEFLAQAEEQRAFLLRSQSKDRQRAQDNLEAVLRERMEMRSRKRGGAGGRNKWEEAELGGVAFDPALPGGQSVSPQKYKY